MLPKDPKFDYGDREAVCRILDAKKVPFVLWMDDVWSYYRHNSLSIDTCTILVHDLDDAVNALTPYGYTEVPEPADEDELVISDFGSVVGMQRRKLKSNYNQKNASAIATLLGLHLPDLQRTDKEWAEATNGPFVFLLDSDFGMDVTTHDGIIPTLAEYVDAMIDKALTMSEPLVAEVALDALYTVHKRADTLPALRDPEFTGKLKEENRQWHLDALAGKVWDEAYEARARAARQRGEN